MILFIYTPQSAHAGTTTADFLKWERKSQDSFLQTSISMAGVIASQVKPSVARCIDDWYYTSEAIKNQRHTEILKVMHDYEEFTPHEVLMAYLENVCGKFSPKT